LLANADSGTKMVQEDLLSGWENRCLWSANNRWTGETMSYAKPQGKITCVFVLQVTFF